MAENNDTAEILRQIAEAASNAARELDPLAAAEKKAAEEAEKNAKALGSLAKTTVGLTASFSKAMLNASDTAGKYAQGVEAAGSSVRNLTSSMGPLAKGVGIVVDLFSKLAGGVLKQNEALVKTYRSLSQVGDLGKSFSDIMDDMHNAGFSVDQSAELYANAIRKAAPGLATFAGSMSDGTDALLDNHRAMMLSEKQFQRFGYTQEELFDRTAAYMGILSQTGGKQKMTTSELSKATGQYLENLVQLSMLTGQSRDELESKMQKDATDLRYQMYLSEQDEQAQLRVQAVMMDLPDSLREGAKSILVNQGRVVDEQGAAFFQALGHKGINAMMGAINDKTSEVGAAVGKMQKTHAEILEKQFDTFKPVIKTGNDSLKDLALVNDTRTYMLRAQNFDQEKFNNRWAKLRDESANAEMDENTTRLQRERKMRNAFEQFEFQMSKYILPIMDAFMESLEALGESMAEFAYTFSAHKIDVRDAFKTFKSMEDVSKTLSEQLQKQSTLEKEETETKKKLEELEKKRLELIDRRVKAGINPQMAAAHTDFDDQIAAQKEKLSDIHGEQYRTNKLIAKARTSGNRFMESAPVTQYKLPENYQQREFSPKQLSDIVKFTGGTGDFEHFKRMDSAAANAFVDMATEYFKLYGDKLQVNSSFRSFEEQQNVKSGNNPKAQAGNSLHNIGKALDLNSDQVQSLLSSGLLTKYGFSPLRGDPPHISYGQPQAKNGGIFSGSIKGYNVTLHGDEAVVPMNKGVSKQPLSSVSPFSDNREMTELFSVMYDKLDTLVDLIRRSNGTQDEILTYTKQH